MNTHRYKCDVLCVYIYMCICKDDEYTGYKCDVLCVYIYIYICKDDEYT